MSSDAPNSLDALATGDRPAGHPTGPPPLVGETHVCADCGFSYPTRTMEGVLAEIATLPAQVAQAVTAAGPHAG